MSLFFFLNFNLLTVLPHVSEKLVFSAHNNTRSLPGTFSLPAITEGAFTTVCQRQTPLNQMLNYNKNACCITPKAEHAYEMKLIKHVSAQSPPVFFQ